MDAKEDAIRKLKSELEQVRFRVEVEQEEKRLQQMLRAVLSARYRLQCASRKKAAIPTTLHEPPQGKDGGPFAVYADSNSQVAVVPAERPSALNKAKAKKVALAAHLDKENRVNIETLLLRWQE